jgi:AraC-like DNA-binding protein
MRSQEQAVFWRAPEFGDLELLRASYRTHTFVRHAHDGFAIGVIERGAETFEYRRQWFVAPAGSVVVINPGEMHTGQAATPQGWSYRMLYPDAALLLQAASEVGGHTRDVPFFPSPVIDDPPLAQLMLQLHATLEQPSATLEQQSRFVWTLAHLIARHADDRPRVLPAGKEHHAVQRVRAYLEAHYAHNVSLDQLAALINVSPFHLVHVFRDAIGLPPHAYLTQVRLRHAKRLLAAGLPIVQVAAETGFTDQSHLTRHFKHLVGVTPGQYAQRRKNVQDFMR